LHQESQVRRATAISYCWWVGWSPSVCWFTPFPRIIWT